MPPDPAMLGEAGTAFSDALQPGADARRFVEDQLQQLARVLPAADAWAVLGQWNNATLALLAGDLLVRISRETGPDGEPRLVASAHPLRITEVRYRQNDERTFWEFALHERDPLRVKGRITAESPDRAEAFARTLAASIGWRIAEPHEQPADAGSSSQGEADRQRITDIWGNPVSGRRRR